jgi:putative membrane protein
MDLSPVARSLSTLPNFAAFFALSAALVCAFTALYLRVTPWSEIALIRQGNVTASLSLSGAIIGFVLPLAAVIAHSVALLDVLIWGIVASIVQLLVFGAIALLEPGLSARIEKDELAAGIFLGAASIAGGLINAACMSY